MAGALYLCILSVGIQIESISTMDFLLGNGELTFVSKLEIKDFNLQINFDVKEETLDKLGNTYMDLANRLTKIPGFTISSVQGKKAKALLAIGTPLMLQITRLGKTIRKYLNPLITTADSDSCTYTHTLMTDTELLALDVYFKDEISKISFTSTTTDLIADKSKEQIIFEVLQKIDFELRFAVSKFSTILHLVDTLLSNRYPTSLNGIYYDIPCIGVLTNENHRVKSCTKFASGISCNIEISYPKEKRTMPILIAVPYMGHYISGPNGEHLFVQDQTSGFYQALNCYQPPQFEKNYETCQLTRLDPTCELALTHKDYVQAINMCAWEKSTLMPPSVRLFDHSILITDPSVQVYSRTGSGVELITINPPYKLESNNIITVEGSGVSLEYPGNSNFTTTRVVNSTLSPMVIRALTNRLSYLSYWKILWIPSPIDYSLFSVNGITIVIIIIITRRLGRVRQRINQIRKMRFVPRGTLLRRPRVTVGSTPLS